MKNKRSTYSISFSYSVLGSDCKFENLHLPFILVMVGSNPPKKYVGNILMPYASMMLIVYKDVKSSLNLVTLYFFLEMNKFFSDYQV